MALLSALALPACASVLEQRDYQAVVWDDGDPARIEVWIRQGTTWSGQPWYFVLDVACTPLIWLAETTFAVQAWRKDDRRIAGGPLGYLASLLPGITCSPLYQRSRGLYLMDALHLPADERRRLASLDGKAGVAWLAGCYEASPTDGPERAARIREWVSEVRLAPPESAR